METSIKIPIQKLVDDLQEFYTGYYVAPWDFRTQKYNYELEVAEADGFKLFADLRMQNEKDPGLVYTILSVSPIIYDSEGSSLVIDDEDHEMLCELLEKLAIAEVDPNFSDD